MVDASTHRLTEEQRALLALWAVPGLGPRGLAALRARLGEALAPLLRLPVAGWLGEAGLNAPVRQRLLLAERLEVLAEQVLERCAAAQVQLAFAGEPAYPPLLTGVSDAPPLLFYRGSVGPPRRRLAMVGSRHPDAGFLPYARSFAREVAEGGVGVVSGAAEGVDRACHWGALDARGETWAFVGSALDALDAAQAGLLPHVLEGGGAFFSELPPGVRASTSTFPRRNRLISGASNAVLILRAGVDSGSLHTARAASAQGRPVLVLPGDVRNPAAQGGNALLREGAARACLGVEDAWGAVGAHPERALAPGSGPGLEALSREARGAYTLLDRVPRSFDEVLAASQLAPAALLGALVELELSGLVVQHPGKVYEKV